VQIDDDLQNAGAPLLVADHLTLARLRIQDALAGPEPATRADQRREGDRERLKIGSPRSSRDAPRAAALIAEFA
jgi:hypothetical protein